jgi:hypothetical protein
MTDSPRANIATNGASGTLYLAIGGGLTKFPPPSERAQRDTWS